MDFTTIQVQGSQSWRKSWSWRNKFQAQPSMNRKRVYTKRFNTDRKAKLRKLHLTWNEKTTQLLRSRKPKNLVLLATRRSLLSRGTSWESQSTINWIKRRRKHSWVSKNFLSTFAAVIIKEKKKVPGIGTYKNVEKAQDRVTSCAPMYRRKRFWSNL